MAEKGFGVKEVNLIGASGTPTITSPNNLNLNANNVAISTNVSIGGTLSVTGNVSVGGTLTYEDVTNIDSIGIITARKDVIVGRGLTVTGISTFSGDVHFSLHGAGNPKIHFDESSDLLWFKKATVGGSSSKIWLGGGTSYDNLQLQQTYTGGGQSEITTTHSNLLISTANSSGKDVNIHCSNDLIIGTSNLYPFIKGERNSGSDQSVTLYYGQTGSTPYANPKLQTTSTGVTITGTAVATTFSGSGASLTSLPAGNLTGTVADARISTLTASKLSGALPAISGANLTNIPAPVEAPVVNFTVTANGSSAYRFSGGGVDTSADDPDLYLIRGQKYRFNNTTGSNHPFQFRLTTGGSAYTAGVTGDQNGVQFFTPELDAPSKLYYVCTLHSNMVGTIYLRGAGGQNENVGVTTFSSNILTPQQVGCAVRMSTNISHPGNNSFNSGTSWVMPFDTEVWDIGSNFNTSNYTFTAPVSGRYLCCYTIQLETISSWVWNYIYPVVTGTGGNSNTTASTAAGIVFADDGGAGVTGGTNNTAAYRAFTNTVIINLTAGQEVRLGVRGDMTATIKGTTETQWTMQLLG